MSWLDSLKEASFRGVEFHVETVDTTGGNNVVVREYPFQDQPTVFTMGQAADQIKFSAYVIGADYIDQRQALRRALDAAGDGVLIHPTAGSLRVYVAGPYTIKEAPTAEGGMARFDLQFVRADARRYPTEGPASRKLVVSQAAVAKAAATSRMAKEWSLSGKPGWVAEKLVDRVRLATESVWPGLAKATSSLSEYSATLVGNYQALKDGLSSLVLQPRLLADAVATLFEVPRDLTSAQARDLQSAFRWMFQVSDRVSDATDFESVQQPSTAQGVLAMYGGGDPVALDVGSLVRAQMRATQAVGDRFIEVLATAAWMEATAQVELASYDDAIALRSALHDQGMRLLEAGSGATAGSSVPESSVHDAVLGLLTTGLTDLQERSRDLVRLTTYTPQSWMPVWAVSYRLFGTASYADEILALNPHVVHPLLVPPGQPLRIMRHD